MNAIRKLARAVAQEESRADAVRDDGVAPRRAQRALELQRRQRARVRAGSSAAPGSTSTREGAATDAKSTDSLISPGCTRAFARLAGSGGAA